MPLALVFLLFIARAHTGGSVASTTESPNDAADASPILVFDENQETDGNDDAMQRSPISLQSHRLRSLAEQRIRWHYFYCCHVGHCLCDDLIARPWPGVFDVYAQRPQLGFTGQIYPIHSQYQQISGAQGLGDRAASVFKSKLLVILG